MMTNEQIEEYFDHYKEEPVSNFTPADFEEKLERALKNCHDQRLEQMQFSFTD